MTTVQLSNGHRLRLSVASNFLTRARGLLGRKLERGEGLLITPCSAVHTCGMGYAIDAIFLDGSNRILKVVSNLAPWRAAACSGSHAVLELNAGQAHDFGLVTHQQLFLDK